jgi:dTDP-3-amino-2,3,6-trideoxy-4-keto-D-glucose/dTDP-3-amino-3,4,6-trideoxy-alpha-D-glucose/dTDP-2,6-dideoxy-D-kanosamine transaminase
MSYKVAFTDFDLQFVSMHDEIMQAIQAVLVKGDLILRSPVADFESSLADFIGVRYAVGVSNCSDALRLALLACGVEPGDEVITVAHTFVATVAAIVQIGGVPVLVDVGDDYNMDLETLEAAITSRTKAIIPVHLNGRMCDMARLLEIACRHGLLIIEDAAQALGSKFAGRAAGSIGLAGCFSFFPGKILGAIGDAGAVVTNDERLASKLRLLRDHGRASRCEISSWGYNCRLDALQAAVLSVKFKHVTEWIAYRRLLASRYHTGLRELREIMLPHPPAEDSKYFDVYQSYVIRASDQRGLSAFLQERGIEALIYWSRPLHRQTALGLTHFRLPKTEALSKLVLSLPLHVNLTLEQVDYVIKNLREFYSTRSE